MPIASAIKATVGRSFSYEVGDQSLLFVRVVSRNHSAFANRGMAGQSSFDFAKLDPKAAQLHLLISAPDKFDLTVGVEPGPVAGAIEPRSGRITERMRDEFRGGLLGGV